MSDEDGLNVYIAEAVLALMTGERPNVGYDGYCFIDCKRRYNITEVIDEKLDELKDQLK